MCFIVFSNNTVETLIDTRYLPGIIGNKTGPHRNTVGYTERAVNRRSVLRRSVALKMTLLVLLTKSILILQQKKIPESLYPC